MQKNTARIPLRVYSIVTSSGAIKEISDPRIEGGREQRTNHIRLAQYWQPSVIIEIIMNKKKK
jgi:hypothetical protein